MAPTLTPIQADSIVEEVTVEGFNYWRDYNSEGEILVTHLESGMQWCASGESGEPITAATIWERV
jgi:hypothetical protein